MPNLSKASRRLTLALASVVAMAMLGLAWQTGSSAATQLKVDVVIKVEQVGGFVPPTWKTSRLPDVLLYSDGRVLAQRNVNGSVKQMFQGYVSNSVARSEVSAFITAMKVPTGGWGMPSVSDVPSTGVTVIHNGTKSVVSVYALGFNSSNLSKTAITARLNLSKTIATLTKLAGKTAIYQPSTYESWPLWMPGAGKEPSTGIANPAGLFCLSQNGTLVAGKVVLDSPTPSPDLSIEYCHLADGSFAEEWAYFYRASKAGIIWPSGIAIPKGTCTSYAAKAFTPSLRIAGSRQWLLPIGPMINIIWRPVLPGEIACKR
jgi:putative hemolysin